MIQEAWNEKELVENRLIEQLVELGYTHLIGSDLVNERLESDVLLKQRLETAIKRLNPWINESSVTQVIRKVSHISATSLMEANQEFYGYLVNMISVQQDLGKGKKHQTIKLIDFEDIEANEFLVVEQLTIKTAKATIRPDLVLYVNGLPLVVIECKSPMLNPDEQMGQAIHQMLRYQKDVETLFHYNQLCIAASWYQAKVGTIGARPQHYSAWKDPYPYPLEEGMEAQQILTLGMLSRSNLLDLIQTFIVFEGEGQRIIKKVARYQQFRAVNKAIDRIKNAKYNTERGGVIWATQGSGKSISMVFLAVKLRRLKQLQNPTIVVVTDRKDLDDQITATFRRCGFPNPKQATSVSDLRQLLNNAVGETVMTLVHKFQTSEEEKAFPLLSEASNIIVMVDEAHRTQYGTLSVNMRTALPNAIYLGFTGTPIDKDDKHTTKTFGTYIDTYTIEEAVKDGATVPIFYESRLPDVQIQGGSLEEMFNMVTRELDDEARERAKKKYVNDQLIVATPKRIQHIAMDIVKHYEEYIKPNGFKAQVVAINRRAAVMYKEYIDQFTDLESAVVFSTSAKDKDNEMTWKYRLEEEQEKEIIKRFKDPNDPLSFIIVVDKLLTGFDAPIEQVMYLDKPIKEHNLLQAIARTNRTYDKKTYGLLVDYFGVSRFLDEALEKFSNTDVEGALSDIDSVIPRLQMHHQAVLNVFHTVGLDDFDACVKVLEPEDTRQIFEEKFKRFVKDMDMVMPNPKANPYISDLKKFGKIRQAAKNLYRDSGMDISDYGEKVRKVVEDYLVVNHIEVLHEPINLMSDYFNERLEAAKTPETKAAEMEHALKHEIRVKLGSDPIYQTLMERLEELIRRRREHQLQIAEYMEELGSLIKQASQVGKQTKGSLDAKQMPFYRFLEQDEAIEALVEDKKLIEQLTINVTKVIEEYAQIVEWTKKEDTKREMRLAIRREINDTLNARGPFKKTVQGLAELAEVHYGN